MSSQNTNGVAAATKGSVDFKTKVSLAQMLKGGVIMDVVNAEQVSGLLFNPI
jgi:pyridoxal biosynthesis lyase PdxS